MEKKTVFFGIGSKYRINSTMMDALQQLRDKNIPTSRKNVYYAGFDTPHVHVRFVCSGDDDNDLCGLRADAVFGSLWDIMIRRMNPGADNWRKLGISLIDYICMVEREASEYKKVYITTAGSEESEFFKRMLNYTYGKFPERPPVVYLDTDMLPKVEFIPPKSGKTQACLKYIAQEFMKNVNKEIVYGGENNMPTEAEQYVRRDITSLAAAFKRVNNAFNAPKLPGIKTVHFSGPCTVVIWEDKTKTVVRCKDNDVIDYEKGLAMAIAKKALGTNKSGSNYYDIFKKWLPKEEEPIVIDFAEVTGSVEEEKV